MSFNFCTTLMRWMYVLVLLYIRVEASIRNDREIKHLVSKNQKIKWHYKIFDDGHISIDQILANCLAIIRKRKYPLDAKHLSNIGGKTFSNVWARIQQNSEKSELPREKRSFESFVRSSFSPVWVSPSVTVQNTSG